MAEKSPEEKNEYLFEINRRDAERAHDSAAADLTKLNDSAVATGTFAIRSALLINGGAAVSILAFIGGLASQGKVGLGPQLNDIASSLSWFASGVAAAGVASGAAYFTNYFAAEAAASVTKAWDHPFVRPTEKQTTWWKCRVAAQIISVLAGLASLGFFIGGMVDVRHSIERLGNAATIQVQPIENPKR